ncbi:hypothetical protein CQA89_32755, partial [Klebsiella pneumoniae]
TTPSLPATSILTRGNSRLRADEVQLHQQQAAGPVTINADHAKGNYPDNAVFTGNVDINQGE